MALVEGASRFSRNLGVGLIVVGLENHPHVRATTFVTPMEEYMCVLHRWQTWLSV